MTAYPIDLPNLSARSLTMIYTASVASSRSPFTLQEQVSSLSGEAWSIEFSPPTMRRESAEEWIAFALSLRGKYGTFLAGDPAGQTPRGVATGTPLVNGAGQTGNTLTIDGCTSGVTGWMKKGDYFQLGTGASARLYKLIADADTNGSGQTTLEFVPALRSSPSDNDAVVVSGAKGVFRMTNNDVPWSVDQNKNYSFSFQAVEVI